MGTSNPTKVTVQAVIQAPVEKVWSCWTEPQHITKWNQASEDWHAPRAENDLRPGGKFTTRMEAKDGSMGFDFGGVYDEVRTHEWISYTMGDGRRVEISFSGQGGETKIVETFDAESTHPVEFQQAGWQAILDNFKKYTEQS
ncbi:activator of HSP90 ATPase [Paenibacillus faecis]|uniref:SRPBCC family protein n=1 Tax=Paenibacillus faecis TaxID=862114 RepID=UPI001B1F58E5|nr:SRPBCC family protein [Paenibacillus faecis]GIO85632.1 activator of HSP90 ATPase [Paenibacillus faecis]